MSNFIGEVTETIKGGKSGDYQYWTVKTIDHEGAMASKRDECYVQVGDLIEYTIEKFSNGNPKMNIINKGDHVQQNTEQGSQQVPKTHVKSDDIQRYITRQSSIERSLKFFELNGVKPDLNGVCKVAESLTNYVLTGHFPPVKKTNNVTGQPANDENLDDLPF